MKGFLGTSTLGQAQMADATSITMALSQEKLRSR